MVDINADFLVPCLPAQPKQYGQTDPGNALVEAEQRRAGCDLARRAYEAQCVSEYDHAYDRVASQI